MLTVNKKLSPKVDKLLRYFVLVIGLVDVFFQLHFREVGYGVGNRGVSFGLFAGTGLILNILFWVVLLGYVMYLNFRWKENKLSIFCLTVGGTINVLQRLVFGNVWDYLSLPFMPFTNNLSDILVTGAVVLYIIGI